VVDALEDGGRYGLHFGASRADAMEWQCAAAFGNIMFRKSELSFQARSFIGRRLNSGSN
jgi:hypothetical protein